MFFSLILWIGLWFVDKLGSVLIETGSPEREESGLSPLPRQELKQGAHTACHSLSFVFPFLRPLEIRSLILRKFCSKDL